MVDGDSSIVLTGFMGTGKTSVGRVVARRLDREFVDVDALIESRAGESVREIFETKGEAYFRARESEMCAELGTRENLVIATGGGALVDVESLARFANAFVVCLDAGMDDILARLERLADRPLLRDNPRERATELLNARREAYARIAQHVETSGRSVEQVATEIIGLFRQAVE